MSVVDCQMFNRHYVVVVVQVQRDVIFLCSCRVELYLVLVLME